MQKSKYWQIQQLVCKNTKLKAVIVTIIIKAFWNSVRKLLKQKREINFKGYFMFLKKKEN
mgnify:CR=1 FL=1